MAVRAAEIIATLSLATDLGTGLPLEHGLHSTLVATRLADRLEVDDETASQTYYASLLFYVGCTADAEVVAELFPDDEALVTHFTPVMFGSRMELLGGLFRALASGQRSPLAGTLRAARILPRAAKEQRLHLSALCEVARMLTARLGLGEPVQNLFSALPERWDGQGLPYGLEGPAIPLPVRIVQVARDATFHRMVGGRDLALRVVRGRAGRAFDPDVVACLTEGASEVLALGAPASAWERVLAREPPPRRLLEDDRIDAALRAMGDFADLISPYLIGHSSGVAELAAHAAQEAGFEPETVVALHRAAWVHDLGRVGVPVRIWQKPGSLTADEWERVRLHAYLTERILSRSELLAPIAAVAGAHHERVDGTGYHRGVTAAALSPVARLLGAADAFQAMTEPRPYRPALAPDDASAKLSQEASAGRLDADAVAAVLSAAGQSVPRMDRPAGLTDREAEVVGLLARGLQTKQLARALEISSKTADRHIQNAYRKIGVSSRAAAALFAMEHGLARWGELPIARARRGL